MSGQKAKLQSSWKSETCWRVRWDLIESCLSSGGSGSPQMSALAEAMQLGKVFFLFL